MRFKGTAALFLVLAVLGGWVYFTDVRGREERERAEADAALALPVDDEEIAEISLIYPEQTITAVRNDAAGWEFLTPEGLEAAAAEWDRLAGNVGRVERGEVVASEGPDLAGFGLESPALRLVVGMSDGTEEEMLFGDENPAGTHNYAKLGSADAVFLSPSTWLGLLSVELDTLRDKTLLRFDQDQVERIEITPAGLVLARAGDTWSLESPIRTPADDAEVRSFLSSLTSARATGFADETGDTGLDPPSVSVVLSTASGETYTLEIGDAAEETNRYYARDLARDPVFIMANTLVDTATQDIFDWRDKRLAILDRDTIASIVLESADSRLELTGEDGEWELTGEGPADAARVGAMLSELEFSRATDIIDSPGSLTAYGLDDPRLTVVLGTPEGDDFSFSFGADVEAGGLYWKAEDETAVKVVPVTLFEEFSVAAADLAVAEPIP